MNFESNKVGGLPEKEEANEMSEDRYLRSQFQQLSNEFYVLLDEFDKLKKDNEDSLIEEKRIEISKKVDEITEISSRLYKIRL